MPEGEGGVGMDQGLVSLLLHEFTLVGRRRTLAI